MDARVAGLLRRREYAVRANDHAVVREIDSTLTSYGFETTRAAAAPERAVPAAKRSRARTNS